MTVNLLFIKDDSYGIITWHNITIYENIYLCYKLQAQFLVAAAHLMLFFSCLRLFTSTYKRGIQQHQRDLEPKGDFHQSNQVQAAIERVYKIQQQLRKLNWRNWGEYLHTFPIITGIWGRKITHQTACGKCPQEELTSAFLSSCDFFLYCFCSPTTLSGHHMLHHRRGQWMMPATKSWEETLEGLADMRPDSFYMCQTIYKIISSKEKQKIPTNCFTSLGEFLL